jgi:histidinol dehydrogenase
MTPSTLKIRRIDSRRDDIRVEMALLRERLSPQGNIVSEAGRRKTIEVFGEPLSPAQVVERICLEVKNRGIDAVLDYSTRIDNARLSAETIRVPQAELDKAHAEADPQFLNAVRRVRENIRSFQTAILHGDVRVERQGGYLKQRYRPLDRAGICVPGGAAASFHRADDRGACTSRRREAIGRGCPAYEVRIL